MHGSVCVYVCNSSFKGQNVESICNLFFSLFKVWVKIGVKSDILSKLLCVSFTLIILQ